MKYFRFHSLRLATRLTIALTLMSLLQALLIGGFAWYHLSRSLDEEIANRAVNVAQTIAASDSIIAGIERRDIDSLNRIASRLTTVNHALFVVIGDKTATRLAHPNPEKIGGSMADDENGSESNLLVQGNAYVYRANGSLGPSMRARAPVFDDTGEELIGVVSVGYSVDQIDHTIARYRFWLLAVLVIALLASIGLAVIIATRLKKEIFGLEPEAIARLFEEREATLESVREGIIAINRDGIITTFNRTAAQTVGIADHTKIPGKSIADVLPESNLISVIKHGQPQFDQEIWLHDRLMIVNRVPVRQGDDIIGAVSSFRARDELDLVSRKLTQIEQYADSLRSQAHEYSNKLHTIAGLIQLDAKDEALKLIGSETIDHQQLIQLLQEGIPNPVIAGCIVGKFNRAKEMGLKLSIDPESHLSGLPETISADQLVSLMGNLLDNALEATWKQRGANGEVQLSLTDLGHDLIIEVQDQGPGIPEFEQRHIFEKGVSSKEDANHGFGLHLVKLILEQSQGSIHIEPVIEGGTRFICYIPKRRQAL